MPHAMPFPIAFPLQLIAAARNAAERYERMIRCYEALVRYGVAVQLSDYLAAGCPSADTNRTILSRLGPKIQVGHWLEIIRAVTAFQKGGGARPFMPELVSLYYKPGKKPQATPEGELFERTLADIRNEWAHPKETWSAETFEAKYQAHRPLLDRALAAFEFLGRYPLYVPTAVRKQAGVVTAALLLMGPSEHPAHLTGLNLVMSPRVQEHAEEDMTAFLADPDDPGRQLLLCPLSVFSNRDGAEDIFLFDRCRLQKSPIELSYRAVRVGLKPLDIVGGKHYEPLVKQFRSLLAALGADAARPAASHRDTSGLYFAAQKEYIRDRLAGFVGRAALTAALDEFMSEHTRGYFVIRAGPGQGKSAAACRLIDARGAVHHLIDPTGGRADPHLILGSLLAQLVGRTGADIPDGPHERAKLWEELLAPAGEKRLVVIDGLDELPAAADGPPPFLPTAGLPEGVYVVVTARPGAHVDALLDAVNELPHRVYELGPLDAAEMAALVRDRRPGATDPEIERIAVACQGNPLYLLAVVGELARDPHFDLADLPAGIEGFFRQATAHLRRDSKALGRDVLGLLSVARKPLSVRELSQATGRRMREVFDHGLSPVRQFLYAPDDEYSFYHAQFREFVGTKILLEDEPPEYHRMLAEWLRLPGSLNYDYRWESLAHHLFHAADAAGLLAAVDRDFLAEKVRRYGYAVLEDVELVARTMLDGGSPEAVERCVELVEGVRAVAGGDVLANAHWVARPAGFRATVVEPRVPTVPGIDLYVGMRPKIEVGADFVEVVPVGDRLVLVLGDAPGAGLKPAFIARFLGTLLRRQVETNLGPDLGEVIAEASRAIAGREFFDSVSVQVVELSPRRGRLRLANGGTPYPVLYKARRGKADVLPLDGELLRGLPLGGEQPRWQQRRAEIEPGDVFVMMSDGLSEPKRPMSEAAARLAPHLSAAGRSAREIGHAIFDDWRARPREGDYTDDATLIVAVVTGNARNP